MRKDEDRLFKGSVFVEFASVDEAKALVDQESLKYNEEELIKMTKWVVNNTEQFFFLSEAMSTLKIFSVHTNTPERFENTTIIGHFGFVFEENSTKGITFNLNINKGDFICFKKFHFQNVFHPH